MSALHALPQPAPQPTLFTTMTAQQSECAARRARLREFLRSVPASEPDATLDLQAPDGAARRLTRGALTARIEHGLRPRMRRIVERHLIDHVSRGQVAKELGVSLKTLERDEHAALDLLILLIGEASEPAN